MASMSGENRRTALRRSMKLYTVGITQSEALKMTGVSDYVMLDWLPVTYLARSSGLQAKECRHWL